MVFFVFECGVSAQKQVRGDGGQLPQIDYSKQFNMNVFKTGTYSGFNRSFETKQFEAKTLELPNYYGNLKPLPLTEWQSNKQDFYTKNLDLQEFQVRKTSDRWSHQLSLREDENFKTELPPAYEGKSISVKNLEIKEVEVPSNVTGEDLRRLINKGSKPESVKVGRGFNARNVGDQTPPNISAQGQDDSKEQSKTSSQPR